MIEYVCGFMIGDSGLSVALVLKSKPAWQKNRLNGVGGKIEPGETPRQAMVREFKEEAGADTCESDWQHKVTLSFDGGRVYFFLARLTNRTIGLPAKREEEPVLWYPLADVGLKNATIPNLRWLIPMCLDEDLRFPIEIHDVCDAEENGATMREKRAAEVGNA